MIHIKLFKENNQEAAYQKATTSQLGTVLSAEEILTYVQYLHTKEDTGDLERRIREHSKYQLKEIDVHDIDFATYNVNPDVVDDYMQLVDDNDGFSPPIVTDPEYNIIDGVHRANSVSESGYHKIMAWVAL